MFVSRNALVLTLFAVSVRRAGVEVSLEGVVPEMEVLVLIPVAHPFPPAEDARCRNEKDEHRSEHEKAENGPGNDEGAFHTLIRAELPKFALSRLYRAKPAHFPLTALDLAAGRFAVRALRTDADALALAQIPPSIGTGNVDQASGAVRPPPATEVCAGKLSGLVGHEAVVKLTIRSDVSESTVRNVQTHPGRIIRREFVELEVVERREVTSEVQLIRRDYGGVDANVLVLEGRPEPCALVKDWLGLVRAKRSIVFID
mmetsp:Transcript_247/g.406  ORF Transcript_247/g.406 Transcript_247/m.406 type:complete len:258 (+) Transcript_247:2533-3306(+)